MTTLSWQPPRHSWGPPKNHAWVDDKATFSECSICGAFRKREQVPSRRHSPFGPDFITRTMYAAKDAPDVWLQPPKVRCIHRGLRVLP